MLRLKAITGSLILIMLVTNLVFGQYRHSPPGKVEIPLNLPANLSDHETIPFDNALNGPGDMFVIYSLYSDQNTILNSKIIPIHYQCDRFELLGDIGTLYPARDNFLLWEDIPEYGYQKSLPRSSLEDQEVLISSQEAAPNLNIRLDDGTTVCINLVYINFGEVSLVGHTKIMLSEVYDHTAIDLKTAREIPHTYRPDESWFAVKSHFAMTPDGKIQVSPEPIFWGRSTHGLYQSRDPLDNSVIGVGYSNYEFQALAFKETSRSEEILNTLIYASPPSTRSVVLTDRKGLDFQIDQTVWFSGAQFRGSAPFPSSEPYPYTIKYAVNEHPVKTLFTRSLLQSFLPQKDLSAETKTILGLATDRDDTDGDGLSDRLEILMNSDPTDPYTEGDELNDYQLYFEMGMFPPLNRRDFPAEMQAPKPKRYSFDGNPSTTIRPIAKKRGAPLEFKHKKLIEAGRTEEAAQVKRRFHNIAILTLYGEEALADYHRMDYYDRMLRFTPDWDTLLYGSLDSDRDGIPDGLESSGELFGGPNYSNYGIHYWEGDGRLKWAYIMGRYIDGLYIRNFIDTTYAPWGFILIKTEWELDTMLGVDGWDTDNDGLDDFSEYLWHSCPLLRYSDPTAGALNDHHKVQHQFVTPRPDWVAGFQDWDDDGIPNGAELYYMAELGYGILDPYCSSSDWDQYTDREEWMSWQYKNCDMCDYPLDDPLPYVVRNGCHPLLPAYPVPNFTHLYDDITIPFSDVITAARGISGSSGISASIKNSYSLSAGLDLTFIPSVSIKETYGTEATTTWSLSESWEMSSSYAYDLGSAWVCNYYRITNVGTEPFDYNPYGAHYFSAKIDILWPGSTSEIYLGNQELNGADGLVPFTFRDTTAGDTLGGPTGGGLPEYVDQKICTILHDYVGVSSDSVDAISLSSFNGFYTGLGLGIPAAALTLVTAGALGHALAGYTAVNVALGSAYAGGYAIVNSYETDIYKNFINRFGQQKEMLTVLHSNPTYNTGRDGVFACDNLCDWTSIMAAHRNYVTVMCLYPEASAYVNVVRESPIRDEITDPADSFFTLKEFIDKFSPSGDGPPKIEEFTWSEEVMDTLIQVGCLPYVARGDIWIPDPGSGCDTIDYFGKWVIVSSIDTIAEPFRKDDLCQYHGEYFIGGKTQLRQGDLFIIQYVRDSDLDSLEDNLELITGTNPYNPDTDGDGMYDGAEVMAGLDPLNPNTDNSYYGALDGDEMYYFNTPTSMRPPVETFEGDTIFPSRDAWDVFLNHSPRTTSGHYDFVPWPYNSGGYNSKLDDRYMDANFNGLADWVERYFRDPNNYWNGMFRVEWEGNQSRFNPFGYKDMVLETRGIKVEEGFKHICDTTTLASGNRVLEIIVNDVTGDGSDMWDNSYIYFKLFNCDILATRYLEISYDLWPRTANGKHICIDLIFSDQTRAIVDSTFLDSDGIRMHPAWRPYYVPTDTFHRVTASLAPFEGKIIKSIAIGYEDDPNSQFGRVHAFIDNLSIRNKNIVIDFEPENKPPLGFQVNNMIGTSLGFRAFDALPGLPACSLAQLPSPDPLCTTYIPIDTMVYGPFEKVYELTGYLDPFEKDISDERCWGFTFTCLAEDLEYRLDENSHLGYYVWHESVPQYLMERTDLPKLVPPKTVVDLQIEHPVTRERRMMLDYLAEIGEPITDQWGNSLIPSERNEFDSDGDESWRPVSGNFWRYIDVELPDELTGWLVQRVYFRYQTDLPCVGNLRSYFDHVSLFERRDDYYQDPYHYYTSFGDPIADAYDNNMNDIIDWEEVNIHNVDNLHNDFAKYTYALLLKSNDLGPLTFKVDTLSGDTTWFWFKIDVSTGDTSWSWFNTFAMNPDSTFKLANTWIAPEDSYTTLIDVENFMTAVWEEADPRHIYGYMTHVNADQSRIYSPYMLNRRALDGTKGVLKIDATNTDINRKMLLFDVHQTPPCTLCTKHCLFLMYDGWVDTGKIWLGYKYQGIANEYWFPEFSNTTRFSYRHPVPYTFDAADSSKIVESIWLKAEDSTIGYLDNFRLQRIYYRSFEPNEPPHFLPNDMVSFRNIDSAAAECSVYHVDDAGPLAPEPTHGEYYLKISGEFNGYSPSWFRYLIFDFPFPNELQLTNQSELNFNICYNFNPLISFGNAIIDLELELSGGGTAYLHEYYLLDDKGQTYAPPLRRDGVGDWINVNVNLSGLPADSKVKNISVYFKEPVIVTSGTYEIYIDELIISF